MRLQDQVLKCLQDIKTDMEQNMAKHGRNASGESVKSLQVMTQQQGTTILGVLRSNGKIKAWEVMERGRPPGPTPDNFHAIIRKWIMDKGIRVQPKPYIKPERGKNKSPQDRGLDELAARIAYTIKTKGTALFRRNGFDDIYSGSINRRLMELRQALSFSIVTEIKRIHQTVKKT